MCRTSDSCSQLRGRGVLANEERRRTSEGDVPTRTICRRCSGGCRRRLRPACPQTSVWLR